MEDQVLEILWSQEAEFDLDDIEEYYKNGRSPETATDRIVEIVLSTEEMVFSKQFQIDEFDPTCRRIIVKKKFRVLYKVFDETILITRIYPTKKNPDGLVQKK